VEFAGRVPREQLINAFGNYTALVFPSLHDTGGLVVLEALSQGSPVVCLDLGGPGIIVNASCGVVVPTVDGDEHCAVTRIANAMNFLAAMTDGESAQLSQQAIARATQLSWSALTNNLTGSLD
jgi:glycosyltransferase involved in cell wall biosynthesis